MSNEWPILLATVVTWLVLWALISWWLGRDE